jgi:hypothetical protein
MVSKAAQSIEAELAAYQDRMEKAKAPAWRPEPNTTIVAEVTGRSMRTSDYGPYPVITYLNKQTGEILNVHAFHQLLRDRLKELGTNIGDVHVITYIGSRVTNDTKNAEPDKQRSYHDYYVEPFGQVNQTEENFTF